MIQIYKLQGVEKLIKIIKIKPIMFLYAGSNVNTKEKRELSGTLTGQTSSNPIY
jgi:hypothetical protein